MGWSCRGESCWVYGGWGWVLQEEIGVCCGAGMCVVLQVKLGITAWGRGSVDLQRPSGVTCVGMGGAGLGSWRSPVVALALCRESYRVRGIWRQAGSWT